MLRDHPVRAAAERGAAATLHVVVGDDPRELRSSGVGPRPGATQVLVPAVLRAAQTAGGRWTGGGRVLLIAPADGLVRAAPRAAGHAPRACSPRPPGAISRWRC